MGVNPKGEATLTDHAKQAFSRAEASFKRQEQKRAKVAADHEAEGDAVREKTARLKSLRLAKQAAETADSDKQPADKAIPIDKLNATNDG
jgi:hypothetical protein